MHLTTLFRVMNPHQRCLQAKVKYRNEPKQVLPKSQDLSRSLEINAIWTFDTEFPTIFICHYVMPTAHTSDIIAQSLVMGSEHITEGVWSFPIYLQTLTMMRPNRARRKLGNV